MASSLRKRLTKRQARPDLKERTSDGDTSSGNSSSEDVKSHSPPDKNNQPIPRDDLSGTPPPERTLRSSSESSPAQPLLFRYLNRGTAKRIATTSPLKTSKSATERKSDEGVASSDRLLVDRPLTSPKNTNEPLAAEAVTRRKTKVFDGVEFEMVNKDQAFEAPADSHDQEPAVPQRRATRSETRRQQREDSHNSIVRTAEADVPRALTVRKVHDIERSVSPRTDGRDKKTPCSEPASFTSPGHAEDQPTLSLATTPDGAMTTTSTSQLPIRSTSTTGITKLSSYLRSPQAKSVGDAFPPTSVVPPIFNSTTPAGYTWTSPIGTSSRPSEPWGWLKKWTCCQCAQLDPHEWPAQTMVEQKICSRLECGHERCKIGCRIMRDQKFDVPSVFSR